MTYEGEVRGGQVMLGDTPTRPSISQRLKAKRDALKAELAAVESALADMEGSPETAALIDKLSRLGHF